MSGARVGERLAPLLLCWPLLVLLFLCWPLEGLPLLSAWYRGAPLAFDPYPHLAGAAFVALAAALPALLLAAARPAAAVRGFPLLCAAAAWALGLALLASPSDTFAARATLVLFFSGLTLVLAGARLCAPQRRFLVLALCALSVLLSARALWGATREPSDLAGVLGNPGPLSQAALPGALCGVLLVARARHTSTLLLGASAVVLFALHAARAPVLAGALAFALASLAGAFLRRGAPARERWTLVLAALSVLALSIWPASAPGEPANASGEVLAPAAAGAAGANAGNLGGVAVRARLWLRVPALLADQPLGVGPGQLQESFPPYRDERERRLSDGQGAARIASEVEHLHSDPLQGLAELGLLGGGAWILFLAVAARATLRRLRAGEPSDASLALALMGMLLNGLVHTPLSVQPTSALIGYLLLGTVLVRHDPAASVSGWRTLLQRAAPLATLAAACAAVPLARHGAALCAYVDAARRIDARLTELAGVAPDPSDAVLRAAAPAARAALQRALAVAPDAVPARLLWARQAHADERIGAWEAVLERRPQHWEALVSLARALSSAGAGERAAELVERARRIAPER